MGGPSITYPLKGLPSRMDSVLITITSSITITNTIREGYPGMVVDSWSQDSQQHSRRTRTPSTQIPYPSLIVIVIISNTTNTSNSNKHPGPSLNLVHWGGGFPHFGVYLYSLREDSLIFPNQRGGDASGYKWHNACPDQKGPGAYWEG